MENLAHSVEDVAEAEGSQGLRLLVSVEEAAGALAISRTAVFRLLREGRLRSVKIDKRRLIAVAALHDFVNDLAEAS